MGKRTRVRGSAVLGALVIPLAAAALAWACAPIATIGSSADGSLSPSEGPPGSQTRVEGRGFPPAPVAIHFDDVSGPLLATTSGPEFSEVVTIPDNATPGVHYIVATAPSAKASATFRVTAAPTSTAPGPDGGSPGASPPSPPQGFFDNGAKVPSRCANRLTVSKAAKPRLARLSGTQAGDALYGHRGRDVLSGLAGDDCLFGYRGSDRLIGGPDRDRLVGGSSADTINGGEGNDRIDGGFGGDLLSGNSGNDRIIGRTGRDRISTGSGNDRVDARDGRRDRRISCGTGRDTVIADRVDRVAHDCERVRRAGSASLRAAKALGPVRVASAR